MAEVKHTHGRGVFTTWYEGRHKGTRNECNARLIAAAPDLLEALQGVLVDDLLEYLPAEYIAKVRAVLAKATGEGVWP